MTARRPLTPRRLDPDRMPSSEDIATAGTVDDLVDAWWLMQRAGRVPWEEMYPVYRAIADRLTQLAEEDPAVVAEVDAIRFPGPTRPGRPGNREDAAAALRLAACRSALRLFNDGPRRCGPFGEMETFPPARGPRGLGGGRPMPPAA